MNSEIQKDIFYYRDYYTYGENKDNASIFKRIGDKCSFKNFCNDGICGCWTPRGVTIIDDTSSFGDSNMQDSKYDSILHHSNYRFIPQQNNISGDQDSKSIKKLSSTSDAPQREKIDTLMYTSKYSQNYGTNNY